MPVDVAAVHRAIGELLKNAAFQRAAAANMPPLDAFEPPMLRAKRFLMAHCVRNNQFDLAALDAFCRRYIGPPDPGNVNVTFEGER